MVNFIKSIWDKFTGAIAHVYHWVLGLVAAVYSYVDRLFKWLENEYISLYHSLVQLSRDAARWVSETAHSIIMLIDKAFHDLYSWAAHAISDVKNWAEDAYHWTVKTFDWLVSKLDAAISDAIKWVIKNIWNPLYNDIMSAIHWIEHYGYDAYDLITHPEKLILILGHYLQGAWLGILNRGGKPVTRFILRQMLGLAPDFVSILEDIISKVL